MVVCFVSKKALDGIRQHVEAGVQDNLLLEWATAWRLNKPVVPLFLSTRYDMDVRQRNGVVRNVPVYGDFDDFEVASDPVLDVPMMLGAGEKGPAVKVSEVLSWLFALQGRFVVPDAVQAASLADILMKLYGETIEHASQFPTLTRHPTVPRRPTLPRSTPAQIDTPTAPTSSSPPLIVGPNLRRSTDPELYIQRSALMTAIDAAFRSGSRICVLRGPGGTGKSFLARTYLRAVASAEAKWVPPETGPRTLMGRRPVDFWLADKTESLVQDYLACVGEGTGGEFPPVVDVELGAAAMLESDDLKQMFSNGTSGEVAVGRALRRWDSGADAASNGALMRDVLASNPLSPTFRESAFVVLDHVQSWTADLAELVQTLDRVRFIVTTRNGLKIEASDGKPLKVAEVSVDAAGEAECVEYLVQALKSRHLTVAEAKHLVKETSPVPLRVVTAAAYLRPSDMSMQRFIETVKKIKSGEPAEGFDGTAEDAVKYYPEVSLSIDALRGLDDSDPWRLLVCCAFLRRRDRIPVQKLQRFFVASLIEQEGAAMRPRKRSASKQRRSSRSPSQSSARIEKTLVQRFETAMYVALDYGLLRQVSSDTLKLLRYIRDEVARIVRNTRTQPTHSTKLAPPSNAGPPASAISDLELATRARAFIEDGETPFHTHARAGDAARLRDLLHRRQALPLAMRPDLDARDHAGRTPLMLAALNGHEEATAVLLDAGCELARSACPSPLVYECAKRDLTAVCRVLMEKGGADPNERGTGFGRKRKAGEGWKSLAHVAALRDNLELYKLLEEKGADFECVDAFGRRPADLDHNKTRLYRIRKKEEENWIHPIIKAAAAGDLDALRSLFKSSTLKAPAQETSPGGWTPLHAASRNGHARCVPTLLQHGADPFALTASGFLPLHLASRAGHAEVAGLLLRAMRGVGDREFSPDACNKHGVTPLILASTFGRVEVIKMLLAAGAKVDAQGYENRTALWEAASNGQNEAIKVLLDHGASVVAQDVQQATPVHAAARLNHVEAIGLLLGGGGPLQKAAVNLTDREGSTPLHYAAEQAQAPAVTELLDHNADPAISDADGLNALHIAASEGAIEVLRVLLKRGADPTILDRGGGIPLHHAAQNGHAEAVKMLLTGAKGGKDVSATVNVPDAEGRTSIHHAARNGHETTVGLLVDRNGDWTVPDNQQWTPLHHAAYNGHDNVMDLLLDLGVAVDNASIRGWTALHIASLNGHTRAVKLLLSRGADPDLKTSTGQTSLHHAAARKNVDVELVMILLSYRADPFVSDLQHSLPLHVAAQTGNANVVNLLIQAGGRDQLSARDEANRIALHLACRSGEAEAVTALLEAWPDGIAAVDVSGWTPLHHAIKSESADVIRLLVRYGALVTAPDATGISPLHLAAMCDTVELLNLLLDTRHPVTPNFDRRGWTPLHCNANDGSCPQIAKRLEEAFPFLLDAMDVEGRTPLIVALAAGMSDVANALLNAGASLSVRNRNGRTPLHQASASGLTDLVSRMLAKGADPSATDNNLWTPLHIACWRGHASVAQLLLERGVDVECNSGDWATPLALAARAGSLECCKVLLKFGADANATDSKGLSVLMRAANPAPEDEEGRDEEVDEIAAIRICELLIESGAKLAHKNRDGLTALEITEIEGVQELLKRKLWEQRSGAGGGVVASR
ncbi:hypothetical protein HDU96_009575 [Phlyctochytrium bullatum]|nr:hypothetical protein HDU96_009575 [Phlyctochytrium bullatum]